MKDASFRNLCPDHRDKINGLPCLKRTVDRYRKFVAEVVDTLDPTNQTPKSIRELREKAIRLNSDVQPDSKAFEIPVHGFIETEFYPDFEVLMRLRGVDISDSSDRLASKLLLLFQTLYPEANANSFNAYPEGGWTVVGKLRCGDLVISSKQDVDWIIATFPVTSLPTSLEIDFNSLPVYGD